MDPEVLKAAIQAIKDGDGDAALALLEKLLTGAGDTPADPAEGAPPTAAGEPAATPPEPAPAAASAADAPATAMLLRVTGARSLADAEPILRSAITAARTADADRTAVTMTARRELIVELIQLGAETPATAWEGRPEDRKPKARLMSESIEDMRARIVSLKARSGTSSGHTPPVGEAAIAAAVAELSPALLTKIKASGRTPEQFIEERNNATRSRVGTVHPTTA